jgi:NADH:ubiquinone oxidoreductase subunit K
MLNAGIPMEAFLVVSTLMFFAGVYGFLTRRNLITILMSVELILNSVNINFLVFNRFLFPDKLQGHFFSLFIIAIAAAEAAVAIAIIINIYRHFNTINVENVDKMKY